MSCLFIAHIAFAQTPTSNPIDPHWQLKWEDNFNSLDTTRWMIHDKVIQHNEYTFCLKENVYTSGGNLILQVNNTK